MLKRKALHFLFDFQRFIYLVIQLDLNQLRFKSAQKNYAQFVIVAIEFQLLNMMQSIVM